MKDYQSLKRRCRAENAETAEDLLHDSFVTALEKGHGHIPGFVYNTYQNHKLTHLRDERQSLVVKASLFACTEDREQPISGEAMDIMKAITVLTEAAHKIFSYRKVTKRVPAFIQIFLWKRPAEEVAAELETTVKSARNLCLDTVAALKKRPELQTYMEIMDHKNFSKATSSNRRNQTKRIRRQRNKRAVT